MECFQNLYDCKLTDITLFNCGFHSYAVKVIFESCRSLDLFTEKKILEMFETCGLSVTPQIADDISLEIKGEDILQEIAEELKLVVYMRKSDINSPLAVYVYAIIDFLGGLEYFTKNFMNVNSVQFLTHLFRFSSNEKLVKSVCKNTPEKVTEIIDVGIGLFKFYIDKFAYPEDLHAYLSTKTDPASVHRYAYTFFSGHGVEQDDKRAVDIFYANREFPHSLHNYATQVCAGKGIEKDLVTAFELYKENWEKNGFADSLATYAISLRAGRGCEKDEKLARELFRKKLGGKQTRIFIAYVRLYVIQRTRGESDQMHARELFRINWEENEDTDSLGNYVNMLRAGIGGDTDIKRAKDLSWQNWEKNGHADSLYNYTCMLADYGKGDMKRVRELYKENWEKNKHKLSLVGYIQCLKIGWGGEKNLQLAEELSVHLSDHELGGLIPL